MHQEEFRGMYIGGVHLGGCSGFSPLDFRGT